MDRQREVEQDQRSQLSAPTSSSPFGLSPAAQSWVAQGLWTAIIAGAVFVGAAQVVRQIHREMMQTASAASTSKPCNCPDHRQPFGPYDPWTGKPRGDAAP